MSRDFAQIDWDDALVDDCRQIVHLAVREDLDRQYDWTTLALIDGEQRGRAAVVARQAGVVAGLQAAHVAVATMNLAAEWSDQMQDGDAVTAGQCVAEIRGSIRDILTAERLLLNLIGRLSGVATQTRRYVDAINGLNCQVYDTRKTTPGWRRLEKYAVRCGRGRNHRTGLFDAILIKDNHLAFSGLEPDEAVRRARDFAATVSSERPEAGQMLVEVEVDTIEQFERAITAAPDVILLDNMSLESLRKAVSLRDQLNPDVQLEASGGVNLETIHGIASTGVDRISVGALTHSVQCLDVGLDWSSDTSG